MAIQNIRQELELRLKDWANSQSPKIPVAWEGKPFTKPTSGVYLQPFLLPTKPMNPSVDGKLIREFGIFHVNCWGIDGQGVGAVEQLAQNIVDLFPILPKVGTVSIEQTPAIENPIIDSGWRVIPVTISYRR